MQNLIEKITEKLGEINPEKVNFQVYGIEKNGSVTYLVSEVSRHMLVKTLSICREIKIMLEEAKK